MQVGFPLCLTMRIQICLRAGAGRLGRSVRARVRPLAALRSLALVASAEQRRALLD